MKEWLRCIGLQTSLAVFGTFLILASPNPIPSAPAAPPVEAAVTSDSKTLGPVACEAVRVHLRREYRKQGMGLIESVRAANKVSDEVINGLVPNAEKASGQKFGAIGDGKILQAILDFLKSPAGQQLIDALVKMLIDLLAHVAPAVPCDGLPNLLNLPPPDVVLTA